MTKYELHRKLQVLELTAHSCVNKVGDGMQYVKDAHAEIRNEWAKVYASIQRKRKVRRTSDKRNG